MSAVSFLADESCDYRVVRALRALGYDVAAVSEETQRSVDLEVIELAARERRILLTEDKDFGWLVYVSAVESPGVILIRYPGAGRERLVAVVQQMVEEQAERLVGAFAVVQPGLVRISGALSRSQQED